ncbi:MAG: hypothetical protein Q9196_006660, partial [Gyalolechia fulgens]
MTPGRRSSSATSNAKKMNKPNLSLSNSLPPVASNRPPKRTSKLQARGATYEPTDNADLLELLNQGPMDDRGIEKRPTPGAVASVVPPNPHVGSNQRLRTSDNTRSSMASTQDGSLANKSIHSTNSRTGLLENPRGQHGGSLSPTSQHILHFDGPTQATRKQRRAKDPYAIDSDSESGDDGDTRRGTPKPQRGEETLLEFLNSNRAPDSFRIPSAFDDLPDLSIYGSDNSPSMKSTSTTRAAAPTPGIRSAAQQAQALHSKAQQQQHGRALASPPAQSSSSQQAPQLPPLGSGNISAHL